MARSSLCTVLLLAALLMLCFSQGLGRRAVFRHQKWKSMVVSKQEFLSMRRMIELDYVDAGPNINAKSGYLSTPPPPGPPAPPPKQD